MISFREFCAVLPPEIDLFESDDSEGPSFEFLKTLTTKPEGYWKLHKIDFFDEAKPEADTARACASAGELVARFIMSNFSSAYDCRLEHALEWRQETEILRTMAQAQVSCNMILAQASVSANPFVAVAQPTPLGGARRAGRQPPIEALFGLVAGVLHAGQRRLRRL